MAKKIWDHLEEYILVISFIITVTLIFVQVMMRYVFGYSLSWSEELARYIFLWQIWLGASFAVKEHRHLRIEAIKGMLPSIAQRWLELVALLIWFGFSLFLAVKGTELVSIMAMRGQVSPALRLPMSYAYASVPLGCGLMSIRLIIEIINLIKYPQKKGAA